MASTAEVPHRQEAPCVDVDIQKEILQLSPEDQKRFWALATSHMAQMGNNPVARRNAMYEAVRSIKESKTRLKVGAVMQPAINYLTGQKVVGEYLLKKTIGQGTFGKVKLGESVVTGEKVAVKIIEKANVKTHKQRNSVQREVRLMKLLNHPHIIDVRDIIETDEQIYIIMEYASGGELFDYIVSRGMVEQDEARAFFRQILSAVDYCHRNSIIHRDLKPENLLLDEHKNIKIIDFGFGNTFHQERTLDTYCGSPFYAAPEMIRGVRYVGPEVDIWSLGVILFALLAGRLPFDAANMSELYDKISKGSYTTPNHFSADVSDLIRRMLMVDPRKRATLQEVIRHKWVNQNFAALINNYMVPRPVMVPTPNAHSVRELVSYGIAEHEIRRLLATPVGLHPITSLYHLVEEARMRKEYQQLLLEQQQSTLLVLDDHIGNFNVLEHVVAPTPPAPYCNLVPVPQDSVSTLHDDDIRNATQATTTSMTTQKPATISIIRPRINEDNPTRKEAQRPPIAPSSNRSLKGLFNVSTTSFKPKQELHVELQRALTSYHIAFQITEEEVYICEDQTNGTQSTGNRFEIEFGGPDRFGAHTINFKRVRGNIWSYKKLCGKIVEAAQL